jgi:hypothetical protein
MKNRPVGGRSSETYSHYTDINNNNFAEGSRGSGLKTESVSFSEMLVTTYESTQRYYPEEHYHYLNGELLPAFYFLNILDII